MKNNNILKDVSILLIVSIMVLSTVAVTADDQKITSACLTTGATLVDYSSEGSINSDLVWDNGYPDFVNGICCQRIGLVTLCDIADDFHTDQNRTITGAEWDSMEDTEYVWNNTGDMIIYEFTPNGPGAEIQTIMNVTNTREYLGEIRWRDWYRYTIDLLDEGLEFELPAGDYFILLRPVSYGTDGQSFWLTSATPPESQSQVYFRSEYFGYPDWREGHLVFGDYYDVNFRLYEGDISPDPDLDCEGDLGWNDVTTRDTVTDEFEVKNIGDPLSNLDWEIESYPDWGTWTFDPESGEDLTPDDDSVVVEVSVVAPEDPETEFEGEIVIVNIEDPDDFCIIEVTLITPYKSPFLQFFESLAQRFPIFALILDIIL